MGSFFTNVNVFTADEDSVEEYLKQKKEKHFYGTTGKRWVTIYPERTESQNEEVIESVTADLSRRFGTFAVAFLVHDGEFLSVWLYNNGKKVKVYDESLALSDMSKKVTLDDVMQLAESLVPLFIEGVSTDDIVAAIRPSEYTPTERRLENLSKMLGFSGGDVVTGYHYLEKDNE